MSEIWVPVAGYEEHYEVSNTGLVRSKDRMDSVGRPARGMVLRPEVRPSGHLRVTLCRDAKTRKLWVHRLVLEAFVGPRPAGMEACHNDGSPSNNVPDNLRWDTKKANAQDRVRHGTDPHARRTHCTHGHELAPGNIYWGQGGTVRRCRVCTLAWQKAKRDTQRELKRAA